MKKLSYILFVFFISTSVQAKNIILCSSAQNNKVIIEINSFKKWKKTFSCIKGDFVSDMSGCAPNGAFSLHAPTGSASMVSVVDRWQDYVDHLGAINSHFETKTAIHFSGGFNGDETGYTEEWAFDLDRLSGIGILKTDKGNTSYNCKAAKPVL